MNDICFSPNICIGFFKAKYNFKNILDLIFDENAYEYNTRNVFEIFHSFWTVISPCNFFKNYSG